MEKREKMVEDGSILLLKIEALCQGKTFGAVMAALFGMMSKILYHVPVDSREFFLAELVKNIREGIELVPELEEAFKIYGKRVILEIEGVRYVRKLAEGLAEGACSQCAVRKYCEQEEDALCCNYHAYFTKLEEDGTV